MREMISLPQQVLNRLRRAKHIAILTGAGVSAESGIPTFRDKLVGLWETFDPADLATPDAFRRDPALVWGWYEWRRAKVLRAQPNAAHRAIATMSASLIEMAARAGSFAIQVNPNPTQADDIVSFSLEGPAGKIIPAVLEAAWGVATGEERSAHEPEVILEVLAEGGSVRLLRQRDSRGGWHYARGLNDGTAALLDEQDGGAKAIESQSAWVSTWAEAMALPDRYPWTMPQCRDVHPEFRQQAWTEVKRRLDEKGGVQVHHLRKRWMRACGIVEPEL